jgi:hypothetical protein
MAAEYLANAVQEVALNAPILFSASIPCNRGYIFHEDGTGVFVMRGITQNQCFATYQVTYNGNIAVPEEGEVTPIAVAITVNGEPKITSRAIFTPQAVDEFGNVTSTAIIKVPKGCCFTVAVENTSSVVDGVAPAINIQNCNVTVSRLA